MHIELTLDGPDGLAQEWYRFWFCERDWALYLDRYERRERPTRRHKFRVVDAYDRLDRKVVPRQPVVLTDEIREKVVQEFVRLASAIKVLKWEDRTE